MEDKVVNAQSGLSATFHIYGVVKSNQLALARLLSLQTGAPFEEEHHRILEDEKAFRDALLQDLGFEYP